MATKIAIPLLLFLLLSSTANATLTLDYYKTSCPSFSKIIQDTVIQKQISNPTTAAGTLRLFLHDCFVEGCDASVLVSSTAFFAAERDADINLSLPGDAFDVVVRAKSALELACPGVVSCADILATATRDLVTMVGGPYYNVPLGRRDGLVSKAARVNGNLPLSNMTVAAIGALFDRKGFTVAEMVTLAGAHTIGLSHCKEFADRVFGFGAGQITDPSMNPRFAEALRKACAGYRANPNTAVFNDIMSPNKFDNEYYLNLEKGLGLLSSDQGLFGDARTRDLVRFYGSDQGAFFAAFGSAMEKLGTVGVKTGRQGEVRRRCDQFNSLTTGNQYN